MEKSLHDRLEAFKKDFSVGHWRQRAKSMFPDKKVIVRMENRKVDIEGLTQPDMNQLFKWVDFTDH